MATYPTQQFVQLQEPAYAQERPGSVDRAHKHLELEVRWELVEAGHLSRAPAIGPREELFLFTMDGRHSLLPQRLGCLWPPSRRGSPSPLLSGLGAGRSAFLSS